MVRSTLRGKQRRYLRGLGVNRKPNVLLGKASLSSAVRTELDQVLDAHELIKVRLLDTVAGDRKEVAKDLAAATSSELVQVLGRTVLLYRRNDEKPGIELPD